jgi:hypothetical protein
LLDFCSYCPVRGSAYLPIEDGEPVSRTCNTNLQLHYQQERSILYMLDVEEMQSGCGLRSNRLQLPERLL